MKEHIPFGYTTFTIMLSELRGRSYGERSYLGIRDDMRVLFMRNLAALALTTTGQPISREELREKMAPPCITADLVAAEFQFDLLRPLESRLGLKALDAHGFRMQVDREHEFSFQGASLSLPDGHTLFPPRWGIFSTKNALRSDRAAFRGEAVDTNPSASCSKEGTTATHADHSPPA